MRKLSLIGQLLLLLMLFSIVPFAYAEKQNSNNAPVKINSTRMIAEKNLITFEGSVVAQKDNMTLYSDRMVVQYDDKRKIQTIHAYGNVKLQQEAKEIIAEKAVYYAKDEKVIFTGHPLFREENNTVAGTKIVYFISTEKSVVENSKVILK